MLLADHVPSARTLLFRTIRFIRGRLFHTRLAKTRLAAWVYRILFEAVAPDLTEPIVFRGVSLRVDPGDRATVPAMVGGYYEQLELDIFTALVAEAKVFLDVGANVGLYSVLGCLNSPRLVAYAFEPIAENQRLLEQNVADHRLQGRVHLQPVAASDRNGVVTMFLNQSATHSIHEQRSDSRRREVSTVTLDEAVNRLGVRPDLVKIDVEGHEPAVIDGAMQTLTENAPTVFVEYIPAAHQNVSGLVERLDAIAATCFIVDEVGGKVREESTAQLDRRKGYNLILTSDPRHVEVIRRFVTV